MRILTAAAAFSLFCQAATAHAAATETGNYRAGNKAHAQLIAAIQWLETHQQTSLLIPALASPQASERLWAAAYLLLHQYPAAEATLHSLACQPGILGFTAKLTLCEWRAGRLTSLW